MTSRQNDLKRIDSALREAAKAVSVFTPGSIEVELKQGGDPVTAADNAINDVLLKILPEDGEGWLSEETVDDLARLGKERVWIVDPLDGTREFIQGIPEWCISIGLVENGRAVAGGILNPSTAELVLGSIETGVTLNGDPVTAVQRSSLEGATVLASRSEVRRGEWERFQNRGFTVVPMGSVAYKLARVAAGLSDATWTLVPKNEWDIAAGVALVLAAGGEAYELDGAVPSFNNRNPLKTGLIAHRSGVRSEVGRVIAAS